MEEEKKSKGKKPFYVFMIIILIVLLIGAVGFVYIRGTHLFDEEKDNNQNTDIVEDNETTPNIYHYDASITGHGLEVAKAFDTKYEDLRLTTINSLTKNVSDFNTLTNDEKLILPEEYYHYLDSIGQEGFSSKPTEENFKTYFSNIFKNEIKFENKDLMCDTWDGKDECHIKYNQENKRYEYDETVRGHGGLRIDEFYSKLLSVKEDGDLYTLTYAKVFGLLAEGPAFEFTDSRAKAASEIKDEDLLFAASEIDMETYDAYKFVEDNIKDEDFSKFDKYIYIVDTSNDNLLLVGYEYQDVK